jgi:hypothetical protein
VIIPGAKALCEALPYLGNKGKFLYGETNMSISSWQQLNQYEYKNAILLFKKNDKR